MAGLVLGALIAPWLVQFAGLSTTPYHDWLGVPVALLAGILVQYLGWILAFLLPLRLIPPSLYKLLSYPAVALPLAGVGYGIYRYLTWVGPGQSSVRSAFFGALVVWWFLDLLIRVIVTRSSQAS
jgi:hypothetical protein